MADAELEYADDFRVTVNLVEDSSETVGDEAWILQFPSGTFDHAGVRRAISDALGWGPARPPFILTDTHHIHSWGAFAESEQIVIAIPAGLASDAIHDGFRRLFRSTRERIQRGRGLWDVGPLGREEAFQRARWHVADHYELGIDPDALMLVSEEEHPEEAGWTFYFEHESSAYAVDFRDSVGLGAFARIRRTAV